MSTDVHRRYMHHIDMLIAGGGASRNYRIVPRLFGQIASCSHWTTLTDRSLLDVSGVDTLSFLQGIVTNDMRRLADKQQPSIYALMLNNRGRVQYDLIVYRRAINHVLVECDTTAATSLMTSLLRFRMHKKVKIVQDNEHVVMAIYRSDGYGKSTEPFDDKKVPLLAIDAPTIDNALMTVVDPRVPQLCNRAIVDRSTRMPSGMLVFGHVPESENYYPDWHTDSLLDFTARRHRLGIVSGVIEMPVDKALPLECNVDLMHGISVNKGCYIGQELTARTIHTGEIRKRLMPFELMIADDSKTDEHSNLIGETIRIATDGRAAGTIRAQSDGGRFGLALMRTAMADESLIVRSLPIRVWKPFWWNTIA